MNKTILRLGMVLASILAVIPNAPAMAFKSCPAETSEEITLRDQSAALLAQGNYKALDAAMNQLQRDYESGKRSDINLLHVMRMSFDTNPALEEKYDGWIAAYPQSYMAYIARGTYIFMHASEARGEKYISKTSPQQIAAMQTLLKPSMLDFSQSKNLTQKPVLAYNGLVAVAMEEGDAVTARKMVDTADVLDPKNFVARYMYMITLQTRWGGSLQKMQDFTEETRKAGLPDEQMICFSQMILEEQSWLKSQDMR